METTSPATAATKKDVVDIMLDLETMGVEEMPVIIQISAVAFDMETGEILNEFNRFVNVRSCAQRGFRVEGPSVEWWLKQTETGAFEKVFLSSFTEGTPIEQALKEFTDWIGLIRLTHCNKYGMYDRGTINLWGNGALADNKWITQAYRLCKMEIPWNYYDDRDVRTIVELGRRFYKEYEPKKIVYTGDKHDGISDCKHQIKYVTEIYQRLLKDAQKVA